MFWSGLGYINGPVWFKNSNLFTYNLLQSVVFDHKPQVFAGWTANEKFCLCSG